MAPADSDPLPFRRLLRGRCSKADSRHAPADRVDQPVNKTSQSPERFRLLAILAAALAIIMPLTTTWAGEEAVSCAPVYQLRIYEVPAENTQVFHERFRDHAARIMAEYDFEILAMWESHFEGNTEFVYLLKWPDVETMEARWAEFMANDEWAAIKAETGARHGDFVNGIEDRALCMTDYSPHGID